jgi:hypothetical protein
VVALKRGQRRPGDLALNSYLRRVGLRRQRSQQLDRGDL